MKQEFNNYTVKITNTDLNIEIIKGNKKIKKNINKELLKEINMSTLLEFGTFDSSLSYFHNNKKESLEDSIRFILSSNLCFSHRIPPFEINMKNNIDLSNDINDMDLIYKKIKSQDVVTTYYCKNQNDLYSAICHHFISNKYRLKQCPICKDWFLENKHAKIMYCDYDECDENKTCTKKANSIREIQSVKSSETKQLHKKIRDKLQRRKDAQGEKEYKEYILNYSIMKEKLNDIDLLNWLSEQSTKYARR